MKLFQDPSSVKDTEHVLSEGQKIVWKKLPMIRNRSRVHYAVQIAIGRLKKKRDHYLANGTNNSRGYGNHHHHHHHHHNVGMSRTISNDSLTGDRHHMYVVETDQDIHHTLDNSPQEVYLDDASLTATYSDIEGDWEGEGNIDTDPLFCDADGNDFTLFLFN